MNDPKRVPGKRKKGNSQILFTKLHPAAMEKKKSTKEFKMKAERYNYGNVGIRVCIIDV